MLTAYQLGHIDSAWEPFFMGSPTDPRNGTEEIITSDVSKAWPIPDAGLGAVSYIFEILMAVMGTHDRWRQMPWMVNFFGILVIPLGAKFGRASVCNTDNNAHHVFSLLI